MSERKAPASTLTECAAAPQRPAARSGPATRPRAALCRRGAARFTAAPAGASRFERGTHRLGEGSPGRGMLRAAPLLLLAGCQAPLGPVFPPISPRLVWPPPPDAPRIEYIGELRGEASLGRRASGLEVIGDWLTGPRAPTPFVAPSAVAVEGDRVFVVDASAPGGPAVQVLDLVTREFRSLRGEGRFRQPLDVTLAGSEIVVADARAAALFVLNPSGQVLRVIGSGELGRPAGVAWVAGDARVADAGTRAGPGDAGGELWVSDAARHDCAVFERGGALVRRVGRRGTAAGEFNFPSGIGVTIWDGQRHVAITDGMNFRVQVMPTSAGVAAGLNAETGASVVPLTIFGQKGDAAGDFARPRDVASDSEGHLYVLDNQFENVQIFDRAGRLLMAFGEEGSGPGQFNLPSGITIDAQDRIWIADTYNRRVQVFRYLPEPAERPS